MNKLIHWTSAAALSFSGFAFVTTARADDTVGNKVDRAVDKTKDAAGNVVDKTKEAAGNVKAKWSDGRIYTMLAQVNNAALTGGGFNDLIERFVDADRTRLMAWAKDKNNKEKLDVLNGRITQFQKDWKVKYGHDFKIHQDDAVFGVAMFTVNQGEIGRDAELAGEKVPPANDIDKNAKLDKGRNIAYVTVAESFGMPELKVPLIHELPDFWKIDVPDSVTGQMLYDNLLKHLTSANDLKDTWPADEKDGYRVIAHHVLMAIMNVDHDAKAAGAKLGADKVEQK